MLAFQVSALNFFFSLSQISNERNTSCEMPTFWQDDGTVVKVETNGCLQSDFDQYGDMEAFGVHPDRQRQLSKLASVQDRLREWKPQVMDKIKVFSCMAITIKTQSS
jgi:alpha-1,3-glucan synthase